jgi:putative transposase
MSISFETTILVAAERFLKDLVKNMGKTSSFNRWWNMVSTGFIFLDTEHHIHSIYEKNIIERTIQYIKDRTECFDYYFPCRKEMNCKLEHAKNWLNLFTNMHKK